MLAEKREDFFRRFEIEGVDDREGVGNFSKELYVFVIVFDMELIIIGYLEIL